MLNLMVTTEAGVQVLLDAQMVSMIVGLVIPLAVGLLSKIDASSGLKAVLNALLSAVAGALAAFSQDGFFASDLQTVLSAILTTWVVSVATYYGVWKPTGVAGTVIDKTRNFGLSSPPMVETDDKGVEDQGPYGRPPA